MEVPYPATHLKCVSFIDAYFFKGFMFRFCFSLSLSFLFGCHLCNERLVFALVIYVMMFLIFQAAQFVHQYPLHYHPSIYTYSTYMPY